MKQIKRLALVLILISSAHTAVADCFHIGLRGLKIGKNPDAFFWDKVSPLIGLEPGRFYSLAPEGLTSVSMSGGKAGQLPGRYYYIPQHLISADNQFSLWLMVVDPDDKTADDTVLPAVERKISLDDKHFSMRHHLISLNIEAFTDAVAAIPNWLQFDLEVRRRAGECDKRSAEGAAMDREYRNRNEVKRLKDRVFHFDKPHLVGGREYRPYYRSSIREVKKVRAIPKAIAIARLNGTELIALGKEIRSLQGTQGYEELWDEYRLLAQRLGKQQFTIKYRQEEEPQQTFRPTLLMHPEWGDAVDDAGRRQLKEWSITLPPTEKPISPAQRVR